MKAVWYTKTGKAEDVLQIGEQDNPVPIAGEVLVRVRASGINPSDVKTRAGARGKLQFPRVIPHSDGSGEIIDVGEGVDKSRIGEKGLDMECSIWKSSWHMCRISYTSLITSG
jgi:NADPH2:quinone reductase